MDKKFYHESEADMGKIPTRKIASQGVSMMKKTETEWQDEINALRKLLSEILKDDYSDIRKSLSEKAEKLLNKD